MADALSIPFPFNALLATNTNILKAHELWQQPEHNAMAAWCQQMQTPQRMIKNWHAEQHLLKQESLFIPVSLGQASPGQTYLSSATNGYISYAKDELDLINDRMSKRLAKLSLSIAEPWFNQLRLDDAVIVNACGVSTQLYPDWSSQTITELTQTLTERFSTRALWLRTLNEKSDASLMEKLHQQGWHFWPSRQIYVFDPKDAADRNKRRNNQIDQKLIKNTSLTRIKHDDFSAQDAEDMAKLYAQLYLEKHSSWNAHYTTSFFEFALKHRWCEFIGYRDHQNKLIAFIGLYANQTSLTTPMLGYDTRLPQNLGLYRLLMGNVIQLADEQQKILNLSAGAPCFKKMRGGEPIIEWHAIYSDHLPLVKQMKMRMTGWLMRKTVPSFLSKQGL